MFSINKPIDNSSYSMSIIDNNNYKGEKKDCNISIKLGLNDILNTAIIPWKYRKVIEKQSNWSRILDFENYSHNKYEKLIDAPIKFKVPNKADNRNNFIMLFTMIAFNKNGLLGFKNIVEDLEYNLWTTYSLGALIVNSKNNKYIITTTDVLSNLNNYDEASETEIRINNPINYPDIFPDNGTILKIYPFISNTISKTPILNMLPLPEKVYSIRAIDSYPEYYTCEITKYTPPTLFTTTLYITNNTNGNYYDMFVDVELSITNSNQQGGYLNYKLIFNGNNIASPNLPLTITNLEISIPAGSPIGTKIKKRAYNIYGNTKEGASEASMNVECININGNTESQKRVEWYI